MALTLDDKKPKPGDMIEIFRPGYMHWALYIGNDLVIHLAPPSELPGAGFNSKGSVYSSKAKVKMEKIWVVVGDDQWRVNNQLDDKYQVRPIHEILRDAQGYVNTVLPYCLFSQNCEHFVTEVRYGKAESRQAVASSALAGLGLILAGAVAAFIRGGSETNKNDEY
ncbi:phospholipase A and acyltransferase 4 isoform X2 [Esox lucius]|uniref:phospholipase A and acyltransferase 4 isoform X2 n=1 Tax=Esox lucius TaxID=8010 RepID=UPI00147762D4|nr:phospholipase A and acyltransferase 4 isoform X2 [Esox lucius]